MNHHEDDIQAAIVRYFRLQYPNYIIAAVPNGAQRNKITASILKRTGTLAGFSDLIIILPNRVIFCEVKTEKGRQSENQKEFQKKIESLGYAYLVVRSIDEFINELKKYI